VRILSVVHQHDAGPGVFGDVADAAGHELEEWVPAEAAPPDPSAFDAALVFGGAMNVDQEADHPWLRPEKQLLRSLLERDTPLLGLCLGGQLVAEAAGTQPGRAPEPEIGWHEVELLPESREDPLLGPLPERITAFQWHSYAFPRPPGATVLARSPVCFQAFRIDDRPAWGLQFHAEVTSAIVGSWLDEYRRDPDAIRIGIDPEAIRAETDERIGEWSELGRGICERFLAFAAP